MEKRFDTIRIIRRVNSFFDVGRAAVLCRSSFRFFRDNQRLFCNKFVNIFSKDLTNFTRFVIIVMVKGRAARQEMA